MTDLWSQDYGQELWREGAVSQSEDGRIWIPYRCMFPLGDLDEISRKGVLGV